MKKFKDLNCILLVDDDKSTNFLHERTVEDTDIDTNVLSINSAQEALDFLTGSGAYAGKELPRPGIIFLDINMPGLSGWDFMEEYRNLDEKQKAKIVVIMLTTSLNYDDEQRGLADENIVTFLHKPLKAEEVNKIAEQYFEKITLGSE